MRHQRQEFGASLIDAASKQMTTEIVSLKAFEAASIIFLYAAMPLEVQTIYLEAAALKLGKKVAYPKIMSQSGEMIFCEANYESLETNQYGKLILQEPNEEKHKIVRPKENDLMILPGVAFDLSLNRLGYGGGYYDRYLGKNGQVYKLGVCLSFQIIESLPVEDFDQKLDALIWEKGITLHK